MNNDTDTVTKEILGEFDDNVGLILTTSSMIEFLLQAGYDTPKIDGRIAAIPGFAQNGVQDDTPYDEAKAGKEVKRLRQLYLREHLKWLYRGSPFLGRKKAAEQLGVTENEVAYIYRGLLSSGELKFKMSIPTFGDPDKRRPLREHLVTD